MNRLELTDLIRNAEPKASEYMEANLYKGAYPFWDQVTKVSHLVVVVAHRMVYDDKSHAVVCSFDGSKYHIWCGDTFLEGKCGVDEAAKRVEQACAGLKNPESLKKSMLSKAYNAFDTSTGCNFHATKGPIKMCKHTHQFLYKNINVIDELDVLYNEVFKNGETSENLELMPINYLNHYKFKKNVLLQGGKGTGKTFLSHEFIDSIEGRQKFSLLATHKLIALKCLVVTLILMILLSGWMVN